MITYFSGDGRRAIELPQLLKAEPGLSLEYSNTAITKFEIF